MKYYEYVLLYVYYCLVIYDKSEDILQKEIGLYFDPKEESIGPFYINIGGKLRQVGLENGAKARAFGSAK